MIKARLQQLLSSQLQSILILVHSILFILQHTIPWIQYDVWYSGSIRSEHHHSWTFSQAIALNDEHNFGELLSNWFGNDRTFISYNPWEGVFELFTDGHWVTFYFDFQIEFLIILALILLVSCFIISLFHQHSSYLQAISFVALNFQFVVVLLGYWLQYRFVQAVAYREDTTVFEMNYIKTMTFHAYWPFLVVLQLVDLSVLLFLTFGLPAKQLESTTKNSSLVSRFPQQAEVLGYHPTSQHLLMLVIYVQAVLLLVCALLFPFAGYHRSFVSERHTYPFSGYWLDTAGLVHLILISLQVVIAFSLVVNFYRGNFSSRLYRSAQIVLLALFVMLIHFFSIIVRTQSGEFEEKYRVTIGFDLALVALIVASIALYMQRPNIH